MKQLVGSGEERRGGVAIIVASLLTCVLLTINHAVVLVAVVMATGIFSFMQNSKSESLMASFANMLPPKVAVTRDGKTDEVGAASLVPGDLVTVVGGDLIPADMRILRCSDNMQVDNASLTGESEPQKRKPKCTHDDALETQNLAFFGTQVPEGSATGVVIATGDHSVMGRIAALAMSTASEQTPINKEIHHFIIIISGIAITLGLAFFLAGVAIKTPIVTNLVFMIGIIVANVPEGLLATVTVCLTLTAKRMSVKKVKPASENEERSEQPNYCSSLRDEYHASSLHSTPRIRKKLTRFRRSWSRTSRESRRSDLPVASVVIRPAR